MLQFEFSSMLRQREQSRGIAGMHKPQTKQFF